MKQHLSRKHTRILLVTSLLLVGMIPLFFLLHSGLGTTVHAQGTPTVSSSYTKVHYGDLFTVTATGFAAGETIQLQVEDQYTDTWNNGTLACDSTGTCVGQARITNGCAGGVFTLIALGQSSQLKATTPLTILPKISALSGNAPQGGPGAQIVVEGDGFARLEGNVYVYWGTRQGINEGLGNVNSCGNLFSQFNAPTQVTPGPYTITVTRSHETPGSMAATFQILPPTLSTTPSSVQPGQSIQLHLQGFANGEQVSVSWNANGGQQLTATSVGYTGDTTTTITPPAAPRGTYTLTAHGGTSGLQATTTLSINPGIQLTPLPINPGSTVTVTGGGFTAKASIEVYFQNTSYGVQQVTSDATGSFTTPLVLPSTYNPNVPYSVFAKSTSGQDQASARVVFMTPTLTFFINGETFGKQVILNAHGFAANEAVKLYWNFKQTGQFVVTTSTADSQGNASFVFNTPSDPALGNVLVAAVGATSKLVAIISTPEQAAVIVNPLSGQPGTTLHITGGGFGSFDQVLVYFNTTLIATRTADVRGAFSATYKVPSTMPIGVYTVGAQGTYSAVTANAPFTVSPVLVLNPTTGPSGTQITISGSKFSPSSQVELSWYDPNACCLNYLMNVTTTLTGTFTVTITAPSSLISGTVYGVYARDSQTGASIQVPFTAQ